MRRFTIEAAFQTLLGTGALAIAPEEMEAARVLFFAGALAVLRRVPEEVASRSREDAEEFLAKLDYEIEQIIPNRR